MIVMISNDTHGKLAPYFIKHYQHNYDFT